MSAIKVLLTGGAGLLGQYLNAELAKEHTLLTLYHKNTGNCLNYNAQQLAITDNAALEKVFKSYQPDVVIHTAALTDVAAGNKGSSKLLFDTNVNATASIASLCEEHGTKLIYLSSDLVYAGYRGSMLTEDKKLIPVSLYAETKLMGEVKVRQHCNNHLILRSSLLLGFGLNHKRSYFDVMYDNLNEGKPVNVFTDQYRTPLSILEASRMIAALVRSSAEGETVNFGGGDRVSRAELGDILCDAAGFDKGLLKKTKMADVPDYPAVEDVSMDSSKLRGLLGVEGQIPLRRAIDELLLYKQFG